MRKALDPLRDVWLVLPLLAAPAAGQEPEAPAPPAREAAPKATLHAVPLRELGPGRVEVLRARLEGPEAECFEPDGWRARLLHPNLELRELAFDELMRLLPCCAQGQRVVQEWARTAEPELAWSARLALRELRRLPGAGWMHVADASGDPPVAEPGAPEERELERRLRRFPGLPDGLFAYGGGLSLHRPRAFSLPSVRYEPIDGRALHVRMGDAGVTVEIVDTNAGEESRRTFEGRSLEQILSAHPELEEHWRGAFDPSRGEPSSQALVIGGVLVLGGSSPAREVLGVECEPISRERAIELELQPEPPCGLVVERTWPGSIATRLDLRRGDVLLELNGHALGSGADLRAAIQEVGPRGRVVVRLIDGEGQTRTLSWEPGDDQ